MTEPAVGPQFPGVDTQDDWETHWQNYADTASSNPAQRYRRRRIMALLARGGMPLRVLDIGSGQGDLAADFRAAFPAVEITGLELSRAGVAISEQKVPSARFVQRDLLADEPVPGDLRGWATHAVCSEVLEHVDRPELLLTNAGAYLAPGCRLVVTVPGGPRSAFDKHIGHRRHYTQAALRDLLTRAGLEVEMVTGAGWPFFNLYKLAVVVRGEALVQDVAAGNDGTGSVVARAVMAIFRLLFAFNLPRSRWGWQIVGVARLPRS